MSIDVPEEEYARIRDLIASEDSPVGIDAEATHVIIIHLLGDLQERLAALEDKVIRLAGGSDDRAR